MKLSGSMLVVLFVLPFAGFAGEADVVGVAVKERGSGLYQFDVTVSHEDKGWEHYVDQWDVVAPDGTVLGSRTLFHPHTDEQPFTRSLVGLRLPAAIREVTVQAHDSVHGYGGKTMTVAVP
jgi:hypothetical protein